VMRRRAGKSSAPVGAPAQTVQGARQSDVVV
jgi:hypothetical protein